MDKVSSVLSDAVEAVDKNEPKLVIEEPEEPKKQLY